MTKNSQRGPAIICTKMLLILFNFIFWISGITLLIAGIWMKVSMTPFLKISTDYSNSVPFSFIGIGAFITVIGFLACFCTAKGQPTLLYLLSIFLLVVFFMEIGVAVAGYVYRTNIQNGLKEGLTNAVEQYGNNERQNKILDHIQHYVKCCGVENYTDWYNTTWANGTDSVPQSCCKVSDCETRPLVSDEEIYVEGCYNKLLDDINSKIGIIAGVAVAFACLQFLGAALAFCLAKQVTGVRYEPMG